MIKRVCILLIFQLAAVIIFCAGFFPQKNVLKGDASFTIEPKLQNESEPMFDKLVLVVIDALRSDFVFEKSSQFSFVHSLLNDGNAWGFTAYSNPPTVTLPRLKGITTGSTPNFLDAILNVAEDNSSSNLKEQDSWLSQFFNHGKRMRFFGDDTWLKLFPTEFFEQHEGTNSFFVSDFEQVDNNVTRHLSEQFAHKKDWDVLILHYLGLDHIGHKGGSKSQFMPAKQIEMDAVIERIYSNVDDRTLICVMGDHGMNNVGNHGGSSPGETSAALLLISKTLKNYEVPAKQQNVHLPIEVTDNLEEAENYQYLTRIQQVDIVPTIAALFNVPIPKNNVGIIISESLQMLNPHLAYVKVKENYNQLISILQGGKWNSLDFDSKDLHKILDQMKDIQDDLTKTATNYNYNNLWIGLIALSFVTLMTIWLTYKQMNLGKPFILIMMVSLLIGLSSFGSSFVEEEHQIWWWITSGFILISALHIPKELHVHILIFICARLIRGWNNSGQKYAYDNTIFEILKKHPMQQWNLNLLTIMVVGLRGTLENPGTFTPSFVLSTICFIYKVSWAIVNREEVPKWMYDLAYRTCAMMASNDTDIVGTSLVPLAQIFFQCLIGITVVRLVYSKLGFNKSKNITEISRYIALLAIFQSPSPNISLFLVFESLKFCLTKLLVTNYKSNAYLIAMVSLILQYFTFFQFGGTNSIATVDLSNAYNGVSENYNIYLVGFMMCVSNFAPSIYWSTFTWDLLYAQNEKWDNFIKNKLTILLFNCVSGCCLLSACLALRFHLFIWSVFSPKLCYYATWNIFMNVLIGWILEGLVILFN